MAPSRPQIWMSDHSPARMSRKDSKEDAVPSALVFTQTVPSLSPFSTVDSRVQQIRQAKLSTFARTVPPLPSTYPLLQSNLDVRTPRPRLRRICLMDPSLPLFLAPPPSTSPSSPYSVTPTVPCIRETCLSVDDLTCEPWTSRGVTSRDSFSPSPLPRPRLPPLPLTAFHLLFLFLPFTYIRLPHRLTWSLCIST